MGNKRPKNIKGIRKVIGKFIVDKYFRRRVVALGLTGTIIGGGIKGYSSYKDHQNSIYKSANLSNLEDIVDEDMYSFNISKYIVNERINICEYQVGVEGFLITDVAEADSEIYIYEQNIRKDPLGNYYYYCENPETGKLGLINVHDLSKSQKIEERAVEFNSMYKVNMQNANDNLSLTNTKDLKSKASSYVKNGEIVFANEDKKSKDYLKIKTNDGRMGYVDSKKVKKIEKAVLMEVIPSYNSQEISENANESINDTKITESSERVLVIGDSADKEKYSEIMYIDEDGNAKLREIDNQLLQEVNLNKETKPLFSQSRYSKVEFMNEKISEWANNPQSGYYGIDISASMKAEDLRNLLKNEPDIKFGIVKIGATGFGNESGGMELVDTSAVYSSSASDIIKEQISIFKENGIPVMAYFYATDINPKEGRKILTYIENGIKSLGEDIQPILDCELDSDLNSDRTYFLNAPNYDMYLKKGKAPIDFEYMKSLAPGDLLDYIENNPSVQDYINYCQDLKAQSIAYIYSSLYEDGYISGKNALLYTGNANVADKDYLARTVTENGINASIALFKYSDVVEYLTNPSSKYYISSDFCLKLQFADYTESQNYNYIENSSAIHQFEGDCKFGDSLYDKNYACPEFIDYMINAKEKSKTIDDEQELDK